MTLQTWKADFFKALAHPARIRILEHLRDGEKSAGEVLEALGLEQSNGSQHLAVLRNRGIVVARREGANVVYSVRDPMLYKILDLLREYFYEHLTEMRSMLEALGEPVTTTAGDAAAEAGIVVEEG
jgi:DNA-binding transcriptional ArsR family regulator